MLNKLKSMDNKVILNVKRLHRDKLSKWMVVITKLGNNGMIWFAVAIPFLFNKSYRNVGVRIILALLLSGFAGEILIKNLVARTRPSKFLLQEEMLIKEPVTYSFPSLGNISVMCSAFSNLTACSKVVAPVPTFSSSAEVSAQE